MFPAATLTDPETLQGQVRFGDTLLGTGTTAGLRQLIGWRSLPDVELSDYPRPQAHGSYPGSAYAGVLTVTGVFLVRGRPEAKALALAAIERATRLDGAERPLVVNDSTGASYRMGKIIARDVPQEVHFTHAPVEVSVQWECSDPRRYDLTEQVASLLLGAATGGLDYPLDYPLEYGTNVGNAAVVSNPGTADAPVVIDFAGPFVNPRVECSAGWALEFETSLAAGETLTVDTAAGTVLLDGADRLYTIAPASDPVEGCTIPADSDASVSLSAATGTGTATVTYRPAYL